MRNRDFKGIWIPKEIWLNEDLSLLDKAILTVISEAEDCDLSNRQLADFCQCSESAITKTVKKLTDLGRIEQVSFNGRQRILKAR